MTTKRLLQALVAAWLCAAPALGETLVLDFGSEPNRSCGETWNREGLDLKLLDWAYNPCGCYRTTSGWVVAGACLEIDVRPLGAVRAVRVAYTDFWPGGGLSVYLLDRLVPVATGFSDTTAVPAEIALDARSLDVERIRVFSHNALVLGVECDYEVVAVARSAWGRIKALYR